MKLSKYQLLILTLARKYDLSNMTLREIGEKVGLNHPQLVKYHMKRLEMAGAIDCVRRSVKSDNSGMFRLIPILGLANCGTARMIAEEHLEGYIKLTKSFVKYGQKLFVVRAVGDSMNRARVLGHKSINDGDLVVVDSNNRNPNIHDYVLSVIDGSANIKRYEVLDGNIYLISESTTNYPPIVIHPDDYRDFMINGRVIDVIKNPANIKYECEEGGEK